MVNEAFLAFCYVRVSLRSVGNGTIKGGVLRVHGVSLQQFLNYICTLPWQTPGSKGILSGRAYQMLGGIHSEEDSTLSLNRGGLCRGGTAILH